ncbi:recombinase RecT [Tessaracoccus sp. MC1627]|uniref:recombinase RecT n=1 Tax=Tessaracoccus sp. MC1627 TaxID=2760312 RepID=UPI0015FFAA1C|nr:recombinase RecT [Tessaracoccus sp. MC1627]
MTTIATRPPEKKTVLSELERVKPYILESLPDHVTPERFARLALTTLRKNPKLMATDPDSFVGALYTAAALGLEPEVNGECYLVPYGRETQLIIGYQGIAKLFWNHPLAARLSAEYVCERDEFDFDKGLAPRLHHKPAIGDRGKVIAYYAIVGLKNGAVWFDVFSPEQIKALRGKVRPSNIADPEQWMNRKTALKQVLKMAPKSTQLHNAVAFDEQAGSIERAGRVFAPAIEAPETTAPAEEVIKAEIVNGGFGDANEPWIDPVTGETA